MDNSRTTLWSQDHNSSSEPRIIPPGDHPITLEALDKDALLVLKKLNGAGFSSYLVGGGVRDLYLDNTPKDFDISTEARPGQIRKLFPNSKTIGRRFRLVQVFFRNGKVIEVSTLRSTAEQNLEGREAVLAPNNTYGSLSEDAWRRDLTINSLFYEIENKTIIDYVQGVEDLDNSIVRIVGDPETRINRDPVRMLRAIRHCARNNFTIEPRSWQSICNNHHKLSLCPPSRLRDELLKDLYGGYAHKWFELSHPSGVFTSLFQFYEKWLRKKSSSGLSYPEQLKRLLKTLDRVNLTLSRNNVSRPRPSFILALTLLPWANAKYDLENLNLKGSATFQFSKKLRSDIDKNLGQQLNLRKSLRQEIVTLLYNLPQIVRFMQDGRTPRGVKKKSYYQDCAFFTAFYLDAIYGRPIPEKHLPSTPRNSKKEQNSRKKERHYKTKNQPAASTRNKGGIFGFKK
jgi:poly(A) polymerase